VAELTDAVTPLCAKEACQGLGIGADPRHVEGSRSKLKKLVARGILTAPAAGVFAIAPATVTGDCDELRARADPATGQTRNRHC
jgi:hypothetical protein